ncbi:MAG TPA: TlpA disulfide reductase family protein [Gemmatimonadaceae bacterium]|nr:TlpA disulfide reductase family protein [Gemmatimonadaceae bacterium]
MNWKRAGLAVLAVTPVIALFAFGFTRDPASIPSPLPGRPAPPFSLSVFTGGDVPHPLAAGDSIRLRDLRGKVVVVNFWASWCGPCRAEHAALSETAREYQSRPVQFLGVLYSDTVPAALRWISEMGGQTYPAVTDPGSVTAIDYGVYGVPETFVIDPDGRVVRKHVGPVTATLLRQWIDSLVPAVTATGPR